MKNSLPNHIAIIPDGNRRWAKKKGLKPWDGHEEGAKKIEELARAALNMKIRNISFWGSSLGNLERRPLKEKRALLGIYERYFRKLIDSKEVHDNEARINVIGRWREYFPEKLKKILEEGIERTKNYKKFTLNFFLAYSGDDEMLEAVKKIVNKFREEAEITRKTIKENLMTKDLPAVDLLIRTGGDPHLSAGFMMWDIADAQLYFSDEFFPEFGAERLKEAVEDYKKRERRMGK
ncbi:MAG: polyprenyl diphosphate synthase [Candidatus Moranbacteria bacterium]|jgi:undecaprenyl diphosphate synthase|nr:polyprenyl diphosphate synthase [Candidatus Moranbacteria bacterium]MDD5651829.1 polyprenyl diphosphate synthase [Candidatus Moranbacteria bacterium]MDX9855498.1 polyprenyl diphosphate synthase [Candidatus Moranbacteria bacterium]